MSENIFSAIDPDVIAKLADVVSEKELSEITVTCGDCSVTIKGRKCLPPPMPPMGMGMPMPPMMTGAPVPPPANAAAPAVPVPPAPAAAAEGSVVKSPIVGTFYSAPSPDKPPFVTVGQHVKKGDVLMIIESMKLMNEIQSDYSGVVAEILAENGQAVEYDQPVMIIKED